MTPIAAVEALATLLWCYAGLSLLAWLNLLRKTPKPQHIPHLTDLLANMVPAMVCLLLVVIAGAMFGFPSVVVLIAILFPAGLAFAFHVSLNDIREGAAPRQDALRIGGAIVLGAAAIYLRQVA